MGKVASASKENYSNLGGYEFAHFRAVTSTGVAAGILCSSSSPVNPWGNHSAIAGRAIKIAGVKTFINLNLADDYKKLTEAFR